MTVGAFDEGCCVGDSEGWAELSFGLTGIYRTDFISNS